MGTRIVKNYPSPRLMQTIGATNQTTAEAIGELVANSFDARFQKEPMNIIIDVRNDSIIVKDNGKGMTSDILEKAICIAEDMSLYMEKGEDTKGFFGMGFKTSCATLGNRYEIYTRPAQGNIEYSVHFDISDYGKKPSGADAWDVLIYEDSPKTSSYLGDLLHGTTFVIKELKDKNITVGAILSYMGEAFKEHLETGDKITIIDRNGSYEAIPKKYTFIQGSKITINETFDGPNNKKYHLDGWMALDTQTHNDGFYGFNIYRRKQLVETHDKSWFRPHLMTSRIIGEVNMDFLDATFYKQGVQQSTDWNYVKIHMKDYLKQMTIASQHISEKGNVNNPAEIRQIITKLHEDYNQPLNESDLPAIPSGTNSTNNGNYGGSSYNIHASGQTSWLPGESSRAINNKIKSVVTEASLFLENNLEITISYAEQEDGGINPYPFDYIFDYIDDKKAELQVNLIKNHPLWRRKVDDVVRQIIAVQDAIYRVLIEELHFGASNALKIRNEWTSKRLEKKGGK